MSQMPVARAPSREIAEELRRIETHLAGCLGGIAIVSASHRSPLQVSDRRPAPTKATPPKPLQERFAYSKQPTPSAH